MYDIYIPTHKINQIWERGVSKCVVLSHVTKASAAEVPYFDGAVSWAADQTIAVEMQATNRIGMTHQRLYRQWAVGADVPDL